MSNGQLIVTTGTLSLGAAKMFLEGITPERFARLPQGNVGIVPTNHPAWVYGHLGMYGSRMLKMLGQEEQAAAVAAPEGWDELFDKGQPCQDDPDGTIYPDMPDIAKHFELSFIAMLNGIADTDDASLAQENPNQASRDRFPTLGVMANFLATAHPMIHLGQVSAWRRMEGLGSALKI